MKATKNLWIIQATFFQNPGCCANRRAPAIAAASKRIGYGASNFLRLSGNLCKALARLDALEPMFRAKFLSAQFFILLAGSALSAADAETLDDFRAAAEKANAVLTIPDWEQTPEAIDASMKAAIARANQALDKIGSQDSGSLTFKSTVVALDDLTYQAGLVANRITLIKEASPDAAMRAAAEKAIKAFEDWAVSIDYREDVYKAVKAFADRHPRLEGEDEKLLKETLRDYRRAGLSLPVDKRKEVEQLRKELSRLGTDFDTNIANTQVPVVFTKADLDGLPESFLSAPGVKTGEDSYTVMANITWQYNTVQENSKKEATRKKLYLARKTLAKDANVPVLNQMLSLRNKIALRLGYKSWDDYQTEVKMAGTGARAQKYINDLIAGIDPKFQSELAELQKLRPPTRTIPMPESWPGTGATTATSGTSKNTPSIRKRCASISRSKMCCKACSTFTSASLT
jgi:hypothetical protein